MDPGEEEAPLEQEQEHIKETDNMSARVNHWVVPKGVNGGPGKEIPVIFSGKLNNFF